MGRDQLQRGDIIDGRYHVRREVARGARTAVYHVQHSVTRRALALKQLHEVNAMRPDDRADFLAEVRLVSELRHPLVVDVYDASEGDKNTAPYVVTELIEGRSLDGILRVRQMTVEQALRLGYALCDVMSAIHAAGLVFLDLCPKNILLPSRQAHAKASGAALKLFDFGAAAMAVAGNEDNAYRLSCADTRAPYCPPEQHDGGPCGPQADVFAICAIVYECITGAPPYGRPRHGAMVAKALKDVNGSVRTGISDVLMRGISLRADERQTDAEVLSRQMEKAYMAAPTPPPPGEDAPEQRRKYARAAYLTPVRVKCGEITVDGTSEDISAGGLLLMVPQDLDEKNVQVRFALPISGRVVSTEAIARWRSSARDGKGATGLEFVDLEWAARDEIDKYVKYFANS